jgi:hypothetical protein
MELVGGGELVVQVPRIPTSMKEYIKKKAMEIR